MIELLIVLIVCTTALFITGGTVWLLYQPVKLQAERSRADIEMQRELQAVNVDRIRQENTINLQAMLKELNP